ADDVAAREITRALTAATMTAVALAAFVTSTASMLTQISTYFASSEIWADGSATAALVVRLLALGLEVAAFLTPYWLLAVEIETPRLVTAGSSGSTSRPARH